MIHIGGRTYELVYDHKNGWNPEAFRNRYSDVLERYDYVIGDWGYNQLRLKGFFRDTHPKVTAGSSFSSMSDYINEYCNFGCAYFVLQKQTGAKREGESEGDIYLDEIDMSERLTGTGDNAESAYRQAVPAAAAQTAAAAEGGETPVPRREHARGPRGPRNDHRRDGHRSSYANRRDQDRDQERGGEQGPAPERAESGGRPERAQEGRKPYYKDRDRSRGDRDNNRQQSGHSSGGDRSGGERPRQKRQHFPPKAPVAAASEGQQSRSRDNAAGSKPNQNQNQNPNANKSDT
ncbi:YutD family protein [Paenibacillus xanthanilyticus]|uniref:YutD-like domain-containing protein n=1 Tax=Paenibacillus xanthanilyticus TaxID=1783531 RepID=A0ABV8K8B7_9BACL